MSSTWRHNRPPDRVGLSGGGSCFMGRLLRRKARLRYPTGTTLAPPARQVCQREGIATSLISFTPRNDIRVSRRRRRRACFDRRLRCASARDNTAKTKPSLSLDPGRAKIGDGKDFEAGFDELSYTLQVCSFAQLFGLCTNVPWNVLSNGSQEER